MLRYLWITLLVLVVDQITKYIANHTLELHAAVPVIQGYFNFMLAYNEGAAFSFLSNAGGWQRWFFTGLAGIVSIVLLVWIKRLGENEKTTAWALSLILGGAVGNLIDRVLFGHVIDFIQWHYQDYYWPAFNIADSAISVGAALLIISALFSRESDKEQQHG